MLVHCHCYWDASWSRGAIKATWVFPVLWIGRDFDVDALSRNVEAALLRGLTTISVYGTGSQKTSKHAAQRWHCPDDTRDRAETVWGGWDKNAELYWRIDVVMMMCYHRHKCCCQTLSCYKKQSDHWNIHTVICIVLISNAKLRSTFQHTLSFQFTHFCVVSTELESNISAL